MDKVEHKALEMVGRPLSVFSQQELKSAPVIDEDVVNVSYSLDDGEAVVRRCRDEQPLFASSQVSTDAERDLENRMRGKEDGEEGLSETKSYRMQVWKRYNGNLKHRRGVLKH